MTATLPPPGFLADLTRCGVVAVIRGSTPGLVTDAALALAAGGITALEVTLTVPGALTVLRTLIDSVPPDVLVGAGTVRNPDHIDQVVAAGAAFIVSPGLTPALTSAIAGCPVPFIPGISTPSELMTALDSGAAAVKLFPGSAGGPPYLRALRGPFPEAAIMPTGGVTPENIPDWFLAGAIAVGAGSDLASPRMIETRDLSGLRERAQTYAAAAKAATNRLRIDSGREDG
jgi:2-dehydro-3-deoxyphosphogluconate aldolase/(4S)-4-hydroxy-2-oxoglutarate aldolase